MKAPSTNPRKSRTSKLTVTTLSLAAIATIYYALGWEPESTHQKRRPVAEKIIPPDASLNEDERKKVSQSIKVAATQIMSQNPPDSIELSIKSLKLVIKNWLDKYLDALDELLDNLAGDDIEKKTTALHGLATLCDQIVTNKDIARTCESEINNFIQCAEDENYLCDKVILDLDSIGCHDQISGEISFPKRCEDSPSYNQLQQCKRDYSQTIHQQTEDEKIVEFEELNKWKQVCLEILADELDINLEKELETINEWAKNKILLYLNQLESLFSDGVISKGEEAVFLNKLEELTILMAKLDSIGLNILDVNFRWRRGTRTLREIYVYLAKAHLSYDSNLTRESLIFAWYLNIASPISDNSSFFFNMKKNFAVDNPGWGTSGQLEPDIVEEIF